MKFFLEYAKRVRFKLIVILYIMGSVLWGISQYKEKIDLNVLKTFNMQDVIDMDLEKLVNYTHEKSLEKDISSLNLQNSHLSGSAIVFNGVASVTSGATFKLRTPVAESWRTHTVRHIHLYGVDTCAPRQKAKLNDQEWPCGAVTTAWLVTKILGKNLSCKQATIRNGISYAQCFVQGIDLAETGLAEGMLVISKDNQDPVPIQYINAEAIARKNKIGIWSSNFIHPLQWRRDNGNYNPFENF
ncbi:hypothetical protein [Bartonella sp. CB189]|uniref:hypothetical protein n=1 Tax=Bartonella sp. CB189 TaxID=3112254 RepID=UPI002F9615E8